MTCSCLDARKRPDGRASTGRLFRIHRKIDSPGCFALYRGRVSRLRERGWDVLVCLLVLAVLFEVLTSNQDVPLALSVPVGLAMTVPLLWGQRTPVPVAALVMGAWVVQSLAGDWELEPQSELLPVCLTFWCLGAYVPKHLGRWAVVGAFVALVVHQYEDVIVLGPLMAGVFAGGRLMQSREQLAAALQAERAHAERYAVAEERARIARELHDVVGHAIAVMTVQAGAERISLGETLPETTRVLEQIEVTGRQTLQEMRRLLGVLRAEEDEAFLSPQPGLDPVDALAERVARSGVRVDVRVEGEPVPLPPGVDISAYRIVQEALTNVLKHAAASAAEIRIAHADRAVEIEVTDNGSARPPASGAAAGGHGLTGMRERVELYGGSLEAGPRVDGGWRLLARLPKDAEA
jgi:signal transduction histidine kinase